MSTKKKFNTNELGEKKIFGKSEKTEKGFKPHSKLFGRFGEQISLPVYFPRKKH